MHDKKSGFENEIIREVRYHKGDNERGGDGNFSGLERGQSKYFVVK